MAFLTAAWHSLVFLNYEVDPRALAPYVPHGVELDRFEGRTLASIVGFRFTQTRLRGIAVPFHTDFSEVNLRFYVRRVVGDEVRRGVVFVKEIVPYPAIALVARATYGERYAFHPMRFSVDRSGAAFRWHACGRWNAVNIQTDGDFAPALEGSEEAFITEHYWGYARRRDGATTEYNVRHPSWGVARGIAASLDCDVTGNYGPEFARALARSPVSTFFADGSDVAVYPGAVLA